MAIAKYNLWETVIPSESRAVAQSMLFQIKMEAPETRRFLFVSPDSLELRSVHA